VGHTSFGARWRWVVALLVIIGTMALTQLVLRQQEYGPQLGLSATWKGNQLTLDRVHPAGWAWDAGLRPGDTVLRVNDLPIEPDDDASLVNTARTVEARAPSGETRRAPVLEPPIPTTHLHQLAFIALAFCLVMIAGAVFVVAEQTGAAVALLASSGMAAVTLLATVGEASGAPSMLVATYFGVVGFGLATIALFLKFPIDRLGQSGARWLWLAFLAIHLGLIASYLAALEMESASYEIVQRATFGVLTLDLLISLTLALVALARPERRRTRYSLALLGLGAAVGFGPFALLSAAPRFIGFDYLVSPDIAILALAALPAAIGASLVTRDLMGITHLVRRGLVALAVWLALIGGSVWTFQLARSLLGPPLLFEFAPFLVPVLTLAFLPIQQTLRTRLEMVLFPDVYNYADVVRHISESVVLSTDPEAVSATVLRSLGKALDLSWAAITLEWHGGCRIYQWGSPPFDGDRPSQAQTVDSLIQAARSDGPTEVLPLPHNGGPRGTLVAGSKRHDVELRPGDLTLLETVAPILGTALERAQLLERLREQVDVLANREGELAALNSKLVQVQELERSHIALDIHDEPLQRAILLARELGDPSVAPKVVEWNEQIREIITSLRAICSGLEPPMLRDLGLPAGLEWLLGEVRARSEVEAVLRIEPKPGTGFGRLAPELEVALYRVAQEALNNSLKHSKATRIDLVLQQTHDRLSLQIDDNGVGFSAPIDGISAKAQLGILGMRERLRPWQGSISIGVTESGGTRVMAAVPRPLEQAHET
jgi:signal transduction histidine kinase